jgi:aryl-alcohol dehydrogenase-like predicted oxidoreductase
LSPGHCQEVKEHTRENLERQWAQSTALLSPHLRLYQVHSATQASGVLGNAEVLRGLERLKAEHGVRIGLTLSGVEQGDTLRAALQVRTTSTGELLFDCVQATWNVMEQSAGDALLQAHHAGLHVIVKEALARNPKP